MNKFIVSSLLIGIMGSLSYAGSFEDRSEMMKSRIKSKMEKYIDNKSAQNFLNEKLDCVEIQKVKKS